MNAATHNTQDSHLSGFDSRIVALDLLEDVLVRRQALDHALERSGALLDLDTRDRAFVRMIVATTLRKLGQIDDLINKTQDRPEALSSERLKNILRLGITQIVFMAVPDHAAVDTSVRLAKHIKMERQSGFVNAVLRRVSSSSAEWIKRQDPNRLNTPDWLLKIWIADYGLRTAAEIAQAHQSEAALDITVKNKDSKIYWGNAFQATELPTGTLRKTSGGSIAELEGFEEGAWWVQDASAAIPAQLFGDLNGQTVVDLCAAPGGKTAQLVDQGGHVIALDRAPNRIKKMQANLERLGLMDGVTIEIADASEWKPQDKDTAVTNILVDAPCTATGTARRHPDVVHLKKPGDMERLTQVQRTILENAFNVLQPGGVLVYCTCSLQKAEGEHQIDQFLKDTPKAKRLPITKKELGGYEEPIDDNGDLRILPFYNAALGGMDGFYIARLTKTK